MGKLKSAIILKDRVFIPDYDSHENMLKELGIDNTKENAERIFVRAELSPENGDVFSDIDTWIFKIDQDITPDWFVMEYDKKRMIEAVKSWAKYHIYVCVDGLFILTGNKFYIKDCTNVVFVGKSCVDAYGKSCVEVYGESSVTAHDNSYVVSMGYSCVTACDNSVVVAWEESSVDAHDRSSVIAREKSSVKAFGKSSVVAHDNSSVIACENSSVMACDNASVKTCDN